MSTDDAEFIRANPLVFLFEFERTAVECHTPGKYPLNFQPIHAIINPGIHKGELDMRLKNGQELIITKAKPEDAKKILEYLNRVGGESDNLLFGKNEFNMTVEQESNFINHLNNSDKSCMLLGFIDGIIASLATLSGFERKRIAHRGKAAVSVRRDYWNSGVGTAMLNELIRFSREDAEIEIIELEVKADNSRAIHVYEKLGFQKIGTYEKYFKINGNYYDCDLLNLYL